MTDERKIDLGLAALVLVGSLALLLTGDTHAGALNVTVAILLTVATALPLVARRRAPLEVFLVTGLASVALRAVAEPAGPPVGATVALYSLAFAAGGGRVGVRGAIGVVAGAMLAHLVAIGIAEDRFPAPEIAFAVVLWSGVWVAGDRARLRQQRMSELEDRARRAEEAAERERRLATAEERMRIARDLHDSAGHAINVILVHAGLGRMRADRDPVAAREAFTTIEEVARETVGEIDQMVGLLREQRNGAGAVEPPAGLAALDDVVERHRAAGLDIEHTIAGDRRAVPPAVGQGAYRIVQEALTNAARHGGGTVSVAIDIGEDALVLDVVNPLRDGAPAGTGHGVAGMRERAALLGGGLSAGTAGGEFRVHASLPLRR